MNNNNTKMKYELCNPTPEGYTDMLIMLVQHPENQSYNYARKQLQGYVRYYAERNPKGFHLEGIEDS